MGLFLRDHPINPITNGAIGAAIAVHRKLGPGLRERTYEICLVEELHHIGLQARRQVPIAVVHRRARIANAYRMDILVEGQLVLELKTVDEIRPVHVSQVLSYLKLTGHRAGLILNFNVVALASGGIRRVLLDR
jgi:GxxExxY protein